MPCVKVMPPSLQFQWVPILAPTHSHPLRFEYLVYTATKSGTGTYPIGDDSLSRSTRRSFAPLQKRPRNLHFMCEQKPYPIWFSCRPKSYPLQCRHSLIRRENGREYIFRSANYLRRRTILERALPKSTYFNRKIGRLLLFKNCKRPDCKSNKMATLEQDGSFKDCDPRKKVDLKNI